MAFVTPYVKRERRFTPVGSHTATKQSFKDECDVNKILARYASTGVLEHVKAPSKHYADVSSFGDYQSSLNVVIEAQQTFMSLPAKLRKRFANDPAEFVNFCCDPNNREEAARLGLLNSTDCTNTEQSTTVVEEADAPISGA